MSPRTGRPKSDNPKSAMIRVRMDKETVDTMKECAETLNTTNSEIIRKGIMLVKSQIEKK